MSTVPPMPVTPVMPDVISPAMVDALRGTRPWVRLLAILGFVGSVFMVLGGLAVALLGVVPGASSTGPVVSAALGALYIGLAVLYVFPSLFLLRYARAIGAALDAPAKTAPIEEALRQQKSFWKFVGVAVVIWLVCVVLAVAVGVVLAVLGMLA